MGRDTRIQCLECEHKFNNDTPAGKVICPNCLTEYRLRVNPTSQEQTLTPYVPLSSSFVSLNKTPNMVIRKSDDAEKAAFVPLPNDDECWFCRRKLTFMTTVRGKVKAGKLLVEKRSTEVVTFVDGEREVIHGKEMVPLPETIAYKTKTVNSCPDCMGKLVKVIPQEKTTTTDKWAKTTGARRQHFSRSVDASTRHEAREEREKEYDPKYVVSTSGPYVLRINTKE